jgi:phosphatidylserine/phosphatidylglycerophosphate/cardiolipin synthase-like enzyme
MKKILLATLLICAANISLAASEPNPIQLVETVPSNTVYENSHSARTETVWLEMVQEAQHSIAIGSFFFSSTPRSAMEKMVGALSDAAKRGVQIRILVDASMEPISQPTLSKFHHKNIETKYIDYKALSGGVMHAKYMVVDEENSFVGSQNFAWKAMSENHEMGVRISNKPLASTLLTVFNQDWELSKSKNKLLTPDNPMFHPAFSPQKRVPASLDWELPQLLHLIDGAKEQVLIQVYQYSDLSGRQLRNRWKALDKALIAAAGRGVKIKLLVSDAMLNNKVGLRGLKGISGIDNIEIKINSIPVFNGKHSYKRVDHAKFMAVDHDMSWVGTGNWQKNYFYNSRDIAIIIRGQTINKQLQNVFLRVWNSKYATPISDIT